MPQPFDAVLLIAFGGPQGPADVRPFLANVLRGRRVTPERVEEVVHHYELFGGLSPLTALTMRQAEGLRARLVASGVPLPVYVGMRNWTPFLRDTLIEMSRSGVRRAIGVIAAAHRSYSSCTQYRENVRDARAGLAELGLSDVEITYVGDWYAHAGFVAANAENVAAARAELPGDLRDRAQLVFTAHSIPTSMADRYPYREQFERTAELVATSCGFVRSRDTTADLAGSWTTVYQSRSGRPEDPWLGPDVVEYLRAARARGLAAAILSPVGFICDHVEVLYDLDVEAAGVCRDIGLPIVRAQAVNDQPQFLDALVDVVLDVHRRYAHGRPLQIVPAPAP